MKLAIVTGVTRNRATVSRIVTPAQALQWLEAQGGGLHSVRSDAGVLEVGDDVEVGHRVGIRGHSASRLPVPDVVLEEGERQRSLRLRDRTVDEDDVAVGPVAGVEGGPDDLCYYISVDVTILGRVYRIGAMVGARESDHGSIRAAGCGVDPYCTAWWTDTNDHAALPSRWLVDPVRGALSRASKRLYREAETLTNLKGEDR